MLAKNQIKCFLILQKKKKKKKSGSEDEPLKKKPPKVVARKRTSKVSTTIEDKSGNSSESSESDSDGKPLSNLKDKQAKPSKQQEEEMSDSDYEPLTVKKKPRRVSAQKGISKVSLAIDEDSENSSDSSVNDSDEETLFNLKAKQTKTSKKKRRKSSDSDFEPSASKKKPRKVAARTKPSRASSSIVKNRKNDSDSSLSDSEGEPLSNLKEKQTKTSSENKEEISDLDDKPLILIKKPQKVVPRKRASKGSYVIGKNSGDDSDSSLNDSEAKSVSHLKGKHTRDPKKKEEMSNSDYEPLSSKKKAQKVATHKRTPKTKTVIDENGGNDSDSSLNDSEELSNLNEEQTRASKKKEEENSDSDYEPLTWKKKSQKIVKRKKAPKANLAIDENSAKESDSSVYGSDDEVASDLKEKETKEVKAESSDSDDEQLISKKKVQKISLTVKTSKSKSAIDKTSKNGCKSDSSMDESEGEPLIKVRGKQKDKANKTEETISESDDEPLMKAKDRSSKTSSVDNKFESDDESRHSSASSDKILANTAKKQAVKEKNAKKIKKVFTESDDEPLNKKGKPSKSGSSNKAVKQNSKNTKLRSDDESCSSSASENSGKIQSNFAKKEQTSKGKTVKSEKSKKSANSTSNKIENMKKYVRAAGIHVQSYPKLFKNCNSEKSKVLKLMELLENEGLKGRPTLEKCKKLKKKIETKKEIAELDVTNIISSKGRPKRNALGSFTSSNVETESTPPKQRFSRLKDIIDSEESD